MTARKRLIGQMNTYLLSVKPLTVWVTPLCSLLRHADRGAKVFQLSVVLPTNHRHTTTPQQCDGVHPTAHTQSLKDAGHMLLDRALRESERRCDALVRQPAQYQRKHIALAKRQAQIGWRYCAFTRRLLVGSSPWLKPLTSRQYRCEGLAEHFWRSSFVDKPLSSSAACLLHDRRLGIIANGQPGCTSALASPLSKSGQAVRVSE